MAPPNSPEIQAIREDIAEIKEAWKKVADALERLARLEERHSSVASALERAFAAIGAQDKRLRSLEHAQPVQRLASGWVMNGSYAALGMFAMLLLKKFGVV